MRDELAGEVSVALRSRHVRDTVLREHDLSYQESDDRADVGHPAEQDCGVFVMVAGE